MDFTKILTYKSFRTESLHYRTFPLDPQPPSLVFTVFFYRLWLPSSVPKTTGKFKSLEIMELTLGTGGGVIYRGDDGRTLLVNVPGSTLYSWTKTVSRYLPLFSSREFSGRPSVETKKTGGLKGNLPVTRVAKWSYPSTRTLIYFTTIPWLNYESVGAEFSCTQDPPSFGRIWATIQIEELPPPLQTI